MGSVSPSCLYLGVTETSYNQVSEHTALWVQGGTAEGPMHPGLRQTKECVWGAEMERQKCCHHELTLQWSEPSVRGWGQFTG